MRINEAQLSFEIKRGVLLPEVSEREPLGGAGARERRAEAAPAGCCLDNGPHKWPHVHPKEDIRKALKATAEVIFCPEGSGVRVKLRNNMRIKTGEERKSLLELLSPERYGQEQEWKRGKRGKITRFSRGSALRLREKMMILNREKLPWFMTLTFPDEFPNPQVAHRHLKVFFKRVQRIFPEVSMLWKLEYKDRLSGKNKGQYAPHFHAFVWDVSISLRSFHKLIKRLWFQVVGSGDRWHRRKGAHVMAIKTYHGMKSYMKKYMSKPFELEGDGSIGRCWGVMGSPPYGRVQKSIVSVDTALRFMKYLRKHEENRRKYLDKISVRFIYRPVKKFKRYYEKDRPDQWIDLLYRIEGPVPF